MDTIILYDKADQEIQTLGLPAGPQELVDEFIDQLLQHPDYAEVERYELLAQGVLVDHQGFPVTGPDA